MNRRIADALAGLVLAVVLVLGLYGTWQAYQRTLAVDGMMVSMMGTSMGGMYGPNPVWYALGTLVVVVLGGGLYMVVRDDLVNHRTGGPSNSDTVAGPASPGATIEEASNRSRTEKPSSPPRDGGAAAPTSTAERRLLDLLPEDERRILEPVLASPGLTQIELRDRADFSKSKISQTVSDLEKRGLLYRERQGRTFRVYPADAVQGESRG